MGSSTPLFALLAAACVALAGCAQLLEAPTITESPEGCTFASTGRSEFMVLEPGYRLVLQGEEGGQPVVLTVTVTRDTKVVDGVTTRVMMEEETKGGELVERSWNYVALCTHTGSVFYYGEDVNDYEGGVVTGHDGAWLAGRDGAQAGVIMPGSPTLGMKYFQEQAPGVAMDHAEVVTMDDSVNTPAGVFQGAMRIQETTPLEPDVVEYKWHAPDVGLVVDGGLRLVRYGRGV
jgi:hypothetical protein